MTETAGDNSAPEPAATPGNERSTVSSKPADPSPIGLALTSGRRILWNGNPPMFLSWLLVPLRLYAFDPILAITAIVLPAALPANIDQFLARAFELLGITVLKRLYGYDVANAELTSTARTSILDHPTVVVVHPHSDLQSAFVGGISFLCSAIGDVAGILANPKKLS
jgi:hypothetical protein